MGASAGLNLRWDRFRYETDGFSWGPTDSPVRLEFELEGTAPALPATVEIAEPPRLRRHTRSTHHAGGPAHPARLHLARPARADRADARPRSRSPAETPVALERETAAAWARRMLSEPTPGQATVIYHSIVSQYLSDEERAALFDGIRSAGERATAEAPLAWLRMEPADDRADLELTVWPGGEDRHLARVGYHGSPVELL